MRGGEEERRLNEYARPVLRAKHFRESCAEEFCRENQRSFSRAFLSVGLGVRLSHCTALRLYGMRCFAGATSLERLGLALFCFVSSRNVSHPSVKTSKPSKQSSSRETPLHLAALLRHGKKKR